MNKTITVFHTQQFLKLGCWIFKNINNYVVQGLQSYKWVCLKCGNIIWYIPAIIGVKHQRWLKSCSLKWKILLREGNKELLHQRWTLYQTADISVSMQLLNKENRGMNMQIRREWPCWVQVYWPECAEDRGLAQWRSCIVAGLSVRLLTLENLIIIHSITRNNATIGRAGFSYRLFRNVWLKCQKNVKLMSAITAKSQFTSTTTSI